MKQIYLSILVISNLLIAQQNNLENPEPKHIFVDIDNTSYECSNHEIIEKNKLEINLTNCSNLVDDFVSDMDSEYQSIGESNWNDHENGTTSPTYGMQLDYF
jgi:hypothetical protein